MNVLFCSYQAVAMPGGGVLTQILRTKEAVEQTGAKVRLFDPWRRYDWSQIDVVHVFQTDMRNYFLLEALPRRVPLVVSPIIDKTFGPLVARTLTTLLSRLPAQVLSSYKSHALAFRRAEIVVSRSTNERMMLERGFGVSASKIRDIPNGVDRRFLKADGRLFADKYGLRAFVLYVGQIGNPRKNLVRLLQVARSMPDVPFVLVGPVLETEYARLVMGLADGMDNVHVLGRLSEEELISAYAACEVFVLPSLVEGTGLVALEAGLAGAKVVVTKNGGPPDYFGDYAVYIEPTVESIREGIQEALGRCHDSRLRAYIAKNFLWDRVGEALVSVYHELL